MGRSGISTEEAKDFLRGLAKKTWTDSEKIAAFNTIADFTAAFVEEMVMDLDSDNYCDDKQGDFRSSLYETSMELLYGKEFWDNYNTLV